MSESPVSSAPESPQLAPAPERRPRSLTLFALGMLIIALLGWLRCILAIRQWTFLSSWAGVSPAYLALSGAGVGLLGLLVVWSLWFRKHWALSLAQSAMLTFALAYWLDQIFVADHPFADPAGVAKPFLPVNWLFAAGVTAVLLLYTGWVLRRAKVKAYFGELNE